MHRIFFMTGFEIKNYLQDPKLMVLIIVAPVVLLLGIGYFLAPLMEEEKPAEAFPVALVNQDETTEAEIIVDLIMEDEDLTAIFEPQLMNIQEAQEKIMDNEIAATVVIPPGFSRGLMRQERQNLIFIGNHNQPIASSLSETMLRSGTNLVSAAQSGVNTIVHYLEEADVPRQELSASVRQSTLPFLFQSLGRRDMLKSETISPWGEITPLEYYSVSLLLIFLLIGGMTTLKPLTISDHSFWQRTITCGVSPSQIVMSRFFSNTIILLIQGVAIFTLFNIFLDNYFRGSFVDLLVIGLTFIFASSALLTLLSFGASSLAAANAIGFLFIVFMAVAGGSLIPMTLLPDWMDPIQWISFLGWASHGLHYALFEARDPSAIINSAVMLVLISIVALQLASLIIRRRVA